MGLLKLIRKIGKFIRGGAGMIQIFLACLLGLLVGMVPGFNLTVVGLIAAVIILNLGLGLVLLGVALGEVLSLLLAPVTFRVGYFVIHGMGLEGLFRAIGDTPVLALLDLHVYCLTGGLIVGLVLGALYGLAFARLMQAVRRGMVAAHDRSESLQRILAKPFVRWPMKILFGGGKKTLKERLTEKPPILRKAGVAVVVVLLVLVAAGSVLLADSSLAGAIAGQLAAVNGAEVDLGGASLSLTSGRLSIEGLQVTDPDKLTHNAVQADRLLSDVSVLDLLAKRLVIDRLEISGVRTDVQRAAPGRRIAKPQPAPESRPGDSGDLLGDFLENREKYEKYWRYLQKLREYLQKNRAAKEGRPEDTSTLADEAARRGYLALSARHILTRHPTVTIRELVIDKITIPGRARAYHLEANDISSHPHLNTEPMVVRFGDLAEAGAAGKFGQRERAFIDFGFQQPGGRHKLDVRLDDVEIGKALKLSKRSPVDVAAGKALVTAAGTFGADSLDLAFGAHVRDMKADARKGQGVLGLSESSSRRIFQGLTQFTLAARIGGTLDRPLLRIDEAKTLEALKGSLVGAARNELAGEIDKRLGKLTDELGQKVGQKAGDVIQKTTGGLLGDLVKPKSSDPNAAGGKETRKPSPLDLLRR